MISETVKYLHSYIITSFISLLNQIILILPKDFFVHANAKATLTMFINRVMPCVNKNKVAFNF